MQSYSLIYTFLMYLQMINIFLTFVLLIIGIVGGIFAIKALLIYLKKNKEMGILVTNKEVVAEEEETAQENDEEEERDLTDVNALEAEMKPSEEIDTKVEKVEEVEKTEE